MIESNKFYFDEARRDPVALLAKIRNMLYTHAGDVASIARTLNMSENGLRRTFRMIGLDIAEVERYRRAGKCRFRLTERGVKEGPRGGVRVMS